MHDPTKVLLGTTQSNIREVDNRKGTIAAGLAVRLKSDETVSFLAADGSLLGISLGKSLSDTGRTAICRKGLRVPVVLGGGLTPVIGAQVHLSDTTGAAVAAGAGATGVNATYSSGVLTGLAEDGTTVSCAFIDMPGGL
jgi:hypothetical protein